MFGMIFSFIMRNIVLHPMVLLGVVGCLYVLLLHDIDFADELLHNKWFYIAVLMIVLFHTLKFRQVHYKASPVVNWPATILNVVPQLLLLIAGVLLSGFLVYVYNADFGEQLDNYLRYQK